MNSNNTTCRPAIIDDVNQVTDVHSAAFPGFFLTSLGTGFLRIMYRAFISNSGGIFVVNEQSNRLDGFAVGVLKSAGKDRNLAIRFLPKFIAALIPGVLRNPIKVLKRVAAQFFAVGEEPEVPENAVMLRSIGVLPDAKGSGVASRLLDEFERLSRAKGATSVALTTDALDNDRAVGFYRKHGYVIAQEFSQNKSRKMLLMLKELQQPD